MKIINFAYDNVVRDKDSIGYSYNTYNQKYYPINGSYKDCCYDYHAPLQYVFEINNIKTKSVTVTETLKKGEKFIYVLTFKYLKDTILKDKIYNFFLTIPAELIQSINLKNCILILNDAHETANYCEKFYQQLILNLSIAKINLNQVVLVTGNASNNVENPPVKTIFWQYFETAMRLSIPKEFFKFDKKFKKNLKKFLCLNRVPRETRYYFMYEMHKRNLLNQFRTSLDKVESIDNIISYNENLFLNSITDKSNFKNMLSTLPWVVDTDRFEINHWNSLNFNFSNENFIFVVTETLFQNNTANTFLTGKTFKPIALKMPFIIIGQPHTLKHLKNLGYKTFEHLWNEDYDNEFNEMSRMTKICNLVENLSSMSNDKLQEMIDKSFNIVNYNFNLLNERRPEAELISFILKQY